MVPISSESVTSLLSFCSLSNSLLSRIFLQEMRVFSSLDFSAAFWGADGFRPELEPCRAG